MKRRLNFFIAILIFSAIFDFIHTTSCIYKKTGEAGECKHIRDCYEVLHAFQHLKEPPILCNDFLRTVCCPLVKSRAENVKKPRVSARKCFKYSEQNMANAPIYNPIIGEYVMDRASTGCNHNIVPLIVGGSEANEAEFPHMALIGFGDGRHEDDYRCGGSLISEQWILSAAHCVQVRREMANFARLGNVIRNQKAENVWTYKITQRVKHPNYSSKFADDDIALFKLSGPVEMNAYIVPICLPTMDKLTTSAAIASGWGTTGTAEDSSNKLMKVIIDYADPRKCTEVYGESQKLASKQTNPYKMICAGSINKTGDTCNGDSGGPLQIYNRDPNVYCMYTVVGITSFGLAYCGSTPALYTKVYHYLDWIEKNVWPGE